jgi:ribosomal protein S18 acetylase RimI-like enzyme
MQAMHFLIRLATRPDVPGLPAIEKAAAVRFEPYGLADVMGEVVTPLKDLYAGAADGSLFVAEENASLVGFALCSPLESGLHLDELDVLPAAGRRGIGTALVNAVVDLARQRGLPYVTLSTLSSIPWNAPWYARLGFRVLTADELTPALEALLEVECARGLPMEGRVLMRRTVA